MMEIGLLGPLVVHLDGDPVELRRQKQRALLALLALHRREVVTADALVEELWEGRPPPTARDALQNYVSQLRKALGREAIETRPPGYVLDIAEEQTDIGRFERLAAEARAATGADTRAALLAEALALWRGPALQDLAYEGFAAVEAARLEELRAAAQEDSFDAELELGNHAALVPRLEALVEVRPYDERARAQLMLALYRSGRQADALETFRDARQSLADQLGLEPSPALRELERAILLQEPSLVAETEPLTEGRRKTVTVLSVELMPAESRDPEHLRAALVERVAAARAAVERHEGWVTTRAGDELIGIFGVPVAHEDDALRAARAAVELRDAVGSDGVRLGIETGTALTGHGFVTGDVIQAARQLQQSAAPGEIAVGSSALALVRHAVGGRRVRGTFRLAAVEDAAPAAARYADAPLTGRDRELDGLTAEFEDVRASGRPRLVALVGEPGIGKSRLARELAGRAAKAATVLTGRCVAYGEGATYLPLREIVSALDLEAALSGEEDAAAVARRVRGLVGLTDGPVTVDEGFWAFRRLVETLARTRPVIVVLDDLHWAEERLLDLVDQLAAGAQGAMLLLAIGRPELLGRRQRWRDEAIELQPLATDDVRTLVGLLGAGLGPATQATFVDLAEGNPLFAEQLLAYAGERGPEAESTVPPSVEALLAARLDLLERAARSTAQRAALIGREFTRAAVEALSAAPERGGLSSDLLQLVGRGFVHPAPGEDERYRFHHVLVRDVAYASLPKTERTELHEVYGDWLAGQPGAADEVVGHHLEQAHRYRIELGLADRRSRQLAADAGTTLGAAGMRAWRRADLPATTDLLARAVDLLPNDMLRRTLLCELGVAYFSAGGTARAERTLEEALDAAVAAGDPMTELRARIELASVGLHRDPEGKAEDLLRAAARATPLFEAAGNDRALGRTWLLVGFVEGGHRCRNRAWEDAAERALAHYGRAAWPSATPLGQLCAALYYGPARADTASARCEALLGDTTSGGVSRAQVLRYQAGLIAMTGDFDTARRLSDEARDTFEELCQPASATYCAAVRGDIELLADDAEAARRSYEILCRFCEENEEYTTLATYATDLAEALYRLGELHQAEHWTDISESHAASDDVGAQFASQAMRARLLARRGAFDRAEPLARQAAALASTTDALNKRAAALLALADALGLAGKAPEAAEAVREALELYEQKGNTVAAERARLVAGSPTT